MSTNTHNKFILLPIANILREAVSACRGINHGIETQSLKEYVFQTTFLKMTGASEQKLKCICWEIANQDYEYRYELLKDKLGECSSYEDKQKVYNTLISKIKKYDKNFTFGSLISNEDAITYIKIFQNEWIQKEISKQQRKKKVILSDIIKRKIECNVLESYKKKYGSILPENIKCELLLNAVIKTNINLVQNSLFQFWSEKEFNIFKSEWKNIFTPSFALNKQLFDESLKNNFISITYNHRNRCAHNLNSYQENLPFLNSIIDKNYKYENYYFRFAFLILLDEIFMKLFSKYIIEKNKSFD